MQVFCILKLMKVLPLAALLFLLGSSLTAQESEEEVFEYQVDRVDWLSGEGVELGGVLIPSLYLQATGGLFEPGPGAEDFAHSGHDPQNDWGVQAVELHLDFPISDRWQGSVSGFGHQGEGEVWEAELEEAELSWKATDALTLGGGQFLNRFGFQSDLHLHDWFFVNQNLANSRLLQEGEFITQGGRLLWQISKGSSLDLGFGGLKGHGHGHARHEPPPGDDHDEGDGGAQGAQGQEHDPHHETDHPASLWPSEEAGFQSWVASADYRFRLPFDDRLTGSLSLALGENGFGRATSVYGLGYRKVWKGHDHGHGGPDFCAGAVMLQGEWMGRHIESQFQGRSLRTEDQALSHSLHFGLSDDLTLSLRHDWVSDLELAGREKRHRLSAAFTAYLDDAQRLRVRVQYDHLRDPKLGSEHVAWLQLQLQWGGIPGSHAGHGH